MILKSRPSDIVFAGVQVIVFPGVSIAKSDPFELFVRESLAFSDPSDQGRERAAREESPGIDYATDGQVQCSWYKPDGLGVRTLLDLDNIESVGDEKVDHLAVRAFYALVFAGYELHIGREQSTVVFGARKTDWVRDMRVIPRGWRDWVGELNQVRREHTSSQPKSNAAVIFRENLE